MKNAWKFAGIVALASALAPWSHAQAQTSLAAASTNEQQVSAAPIPEDQQASKEQLAKLFEVMRLRQQLQSYLKMMPAMIQQQIQTQFKDTTSKLGGEPLTADQQAQLDSVMHKYLEKAVNVVSIDEMLGDMATVYKRHVSSSDVDAYIAFYQSAAGQHLLDAQPAIMQEYMPMAMDRMKERSKALTDQMIADIAEVTKTTTPAAEKPTEK
jgi:hypothetical protein